jgi:hypothetical protein
MELLLAARVKVANGISKLDFKRFKFNLFLGGIGILKNASVWLLEFQLVFPKEFAAAAA